MISLTTASDLAWKAWKDFPEFQAPSARRWCRISGAYGQEVASSVESVEVWDRKDKQIKELTNQELHFGYRMSALKASMYSAPATPAADFFPTPRYVVLSVTFALHHSATGVVGYGQLAKALGVEVSNACRQRIFVTRY